VAIDPGLPEDLSASGRAGATVWHGSEPSASVASRLVTRPAADATRAGEAPSPVRDRAGDAPKGGRDGYERAGFAGAGAAEAVRSARTGIGTCLPSLGHDGPERRVWRPHAQTRQTRYYRGKTQGHTVKNVVLINAGLTILFLRETYAGSTHDTRIADATHSP
jgi:hypothetical protein